MILPDLPDQMETARLIVRAYRCGDYLYGLLRSEWTG